MVKRIQVANIGDDSIMTGKRRIRTLIGGVWFYFFVASALVALGAGFGVGFVLLMKWVAEMGEGG